MYKMRSVPPMPVDPKVSILVVYTILNRDYLGREYITLPRLDERNLKNVEHRLFMKCRESGDTSGVITNIIKLDS